MELLAKLKERGLVKFTLKESEEENLICIWNLHNIIVITFEVLLDESILREILDTPIDKESEKIYLLFWWSHHTRTRHIGNSEALQSERFGYESCC